MRQFLLASAIFLAPPLIAGKAQAVPMLELTVASGGKSTSQTATFDAAGGVQSFGATTVGNFTAYNIAAELFSPSSIGLSSLGLSTSSGGTLTITVTGSNFESPMGLSNWLTQLHGYNYSFSNGLSANVSVTSYLDSSNTLDNPGCLKGCTQLSTVKLDDKATASAFADGLFALTEVITITTTGPRSFGLTAAVTSVPEPMSLALLGTSLIGLGLVRHRAARQAV